METTFKKYERESSFLKVRKEGGTRVVALGKYIPSDWTLVKVSTDFTAEEAGKDNTILIIIQKIA